MKLIQTIALILIFGFLISFPILIILAEDQAFSNGLLLGAGLTRKSIEIDLNNGWKYIPNCALYNNSYPVNSSSILCDSYWVAPSGQEQLDIRLGRGLPYRNR